MFGWLGLRAEGDTAPDVRNRHFDFGSYIWHAHHVPYKDPGRQREYQRVWLANRRAEYFADKVCVRCGKDKHLDIDHVDPMQKVSHRIWAWSRKRREAELAKCQVLCRDCHNAKTAIDMGWQPGVHGASQVYSKGCRCEVCRESHRQRMKEWRERSGYSYLVKVQRRRAKQGLDKT